MMRLVALLLAVAVPIAVPAEVRVVSDRDALVLDVQPAAQGVWTPLPGVGPGYLLNTDGDIHGDGHPGNAALDVGLLVAWTRPGGKVIVAKATEGGEVWRREVDAPSAVGTPQVVSLGDTQLIAWTSGGGDAAVHVAYHWDNGQVTVPQFVDAGALVALLPHGQGALLIVRDAVESELRVWSVIDPQPIPVPLLRVLTTTLSEVSSRGKSATTTTPFPCVASTPDTASIAWRSGPGTVKLLTIEDSIAGDVEELRGGNACQVAGQR